MIEKHYYLYKKGNNIKIIYIDYDKLKGFNFQPKNNIKYDGIKVNKMVVIKPSMIEKVLRRKIKIKLDLYLKLIIKFIDDNDGTNSGGILGEALNDITRYRDIVMNKYRKYLDEKYLKMLLKKIALLEYELKNKLYLLEQYNDVEEKTSHRSR